MDVYKNALLYGKPTDFGVENGRFAFVKPCPAPGVDLQGARLIPGLIDLHTHGAMGADVMDGGDALSVMSEFFLKGGVTAFYPATMAAEKDRLAAVTDRLPDLPGAAAPGYHLEGPVLSPRYRGAHSLPPVEQARAADLPGFAHLKLVTLAPEQPGALAVIPTLSGRAAVCLGHTGCDYDLARSAFQAGAVCVTHALNAMAPPHHRQPGLLGAAVTERAYAQVICDGVHLHPAAVLSLYRLFGPRRMVLITDSMRATGLPDGRYDLGGRPVTVTGGQARGEDGRLAGSTATLLQCVQKAVAFGIPPRAALRMATATPAEMMGLNKGKIAPGYDADCALLRADGRVAAAMVGGRLTRFD